MDLQRARRAQKELFDKSELQALTLTGDKARKEVALYLPAQIADKFSNADNSQGCDARRSRAQSRPRPARATRRSERISHLARNKLRRGKRARRS